MNIKLVQILMTLFLSLQIPVVQSITEVVVSTTNGGNETTQQQDGVYGEAVGPLVHFLHQNYVAGCHTLLIKEGSRDRNFMAILRSLRVANVTTILMDLNLPTFVPNNVLTSYLKQGDKVTCRAFIFDMSSSRSSAVTLQFMENIQFYLIANTFTIFVGPKSHLEGTLGNVTLRNAANVIYLVVEQTLSSPEGLRTLSTFLLKRADQFRSVQIYSRCLFCKNGDAGIRFVDVWNPITGFLLGRPIFEDQFGDMMGRKMKIVQLDWYPLIAFTRNSEEPSTTVTPIDSVNVRMLDAVSRVLNFTYEIRVPWDEQWGVSTDSGNWTGMIGTLQHHKADFAMSVTYVRGRMRVVDYTRIFIREPLVMVMSKPRPPPQYLAIIRPLEADMWVAILVACASAGLILWLLQLAWSKVSDEKRLSLDVCLLYTWSILFEEPAARLPHNTSSLMFLGWWWIFCTLISAVYKSSLIAHLSAPGKTTVINSFEEMLEEGSWTWGFTESDTADYEALKTSDSPIIQEVFQGMEIQGVEEQIERVLSEKHVLLITKFFFKSLKSTISKNQFGVSPFYFSKSEYFANGDGWAFRQNAPFYDAIDMKLQQLTETGHIVQWADELIGTSLEEPCDIGTDCQGENEEGEAPGEILSFETTDRVVLSLNHLQSAFYLLLLGIFAATLSFGGENIYFIFCFQESMP